MRKFLAGILLFGMTVMLAQGQGAGVKLDGTWSLIGDGIEKIPDEFFAKIMAKLVLKDGNYEQIVQGKKLESGKYKIDATKTPATIDFDIMDGPDKGKKQLGIFKLEGDKLTLALNKAGAAARPKAFEAPKDSKDIQIPIFKRSK